MFLQQGFPCSLKNNNIEIYKSRENPVNQTGKKMFIKQWNNVTKTGEKCY
jgi:hypothetical protein